MPGFLTWLSTRFNPAPIMSVASASRPIILTDAAGQLPSPQDDGRAQLETRLLCWLLDADTHGFDQADARERVVLDELARRMRDGHIHLPRQPLTLPMLIRALSDRNADRKRLEKIILADPAVTDQTLRMANSPMFRRGEQDIDSVSQAIFVLGIDGIRSVISASVMRPMLAARNSGEAVFAKRVWLWGLSCAHGAEQVARIRGQDGSAWFLVGLLRALSFITLFREVQRIISVYSPGSAAQPSVIHHALADHQWSMSQLLATEWNLPPHYHACLLEAEHSSPEDTPSPLNDGIALGSWEVLQHSPQPNLTEECLLELVKLTPEQLRKVRQLTLPMLKG